jgi:NADH-quinone oxidoreductase subunit J
VGNFLVWVVWIFAAFACLGSGVAVVSFTNPFYSALALIGNLGSLAVLYLLLAAEFVAAAQVLVYAGAVMVMFLFVIAYLGGEADAPWAGGRLSHEAHVARSFGGPADLGRLFLTSHLLAFEITSIVLLVAAVGGVVLGAHARYHAEWGSASRPEGPAL